MSTHEERCEFMENADYYWGANMIDPSEPGYVPGKGVLIEQSRQCRTKPDAGEKYCPRHKMMVEIAGEAP